VSRGAKSAVAIIAACCVLTVLITPAFDELPSTAARSHLYSSVAALVAIIPFGLQTPSANIMSAAAVAPASSTMDLLARTCSRLI